MELHHKLRRDPNWHPSACNICGGVRPLYLSRPVCCTRCSLVAHAASPVCHLSHIGTAGLCLSSSSARKQCSACKYLCHYSRAWLQSILGARVPSAAVQMISCPALSCEAVNLNLWGATKRVARPLDVPAVQIRLPFWTAKLPQVSLCAPCWLTDCSPSAAQVQMGHQAANCKTGTIPWRKIFGDEAFIVRKPVFWTDILAKRKEREVDLKKVEADAIAYAKGRVASLGMR